MKLAVINFSGNVGKTTISRHLLAPRIKDAEFVSIESINADESEADALRGKDFKQLQTYMQVSENLIVDIGGSNVEDLLTKMRAFIGSHEDFDYFIIPCVPDVKQQKDTAKTFKALVEMGVNSAQIKVLLNRVDTSDTHAAAFEMLEGYLQVCPGAFDPACSIMENEVFQLAQEDGRSISELANDKTDFKALIAKAKDRAEKIALAEKLGLTRLARGVLPQLDACFAALKLT